MARNPRPLLIIHVWARLDQELLLEENLEPNWAPTSIAFYSNLHPCLVLFHEAVTSLADGKTSLPMTHLKYLCCAPRMVLCISWRSCPREHRGTLFRELPLVISGSFLHWHVLWVPPILMIHGENCHKGLQTFVAHTSMSPGNIYLNIIGKHEDLFELL